MKKLLYATLVLVVMSIVFSSCKSHEKCPAYGQAKTEQVQDLA